MHRPGRRIDFPVRQENIIRIIQSNESRVSLIRAVFFFQFPSSSSSSSSRTHRQFYRFLIYIWDRCSIVTTRAQPLRFIAQPNVFLLRILKRMERWIRGYIVSLFFVSSISSFATALLSRYLERRIDRSIYPGSRTEAFVVKRTSDRKCERRGGESGCRRRRRRRRSIRVSDIADKSRPVGVFQQINGEVWVCTGHRENTFL